MQSVLSHWNETVQAARACGYKGDIPDKKDIEGMSACVLVVRNVSKSVQSNDVTLHLVYHGLRSINDELVEVTINRFRDKKYS